VGPSHSSRRGTRALARALALNGALVVTKVAAGVLGHSYALIADGLESTADVMSSLVVYIGLRFSSRPPDADHPYGHGKAEPLAALAVAVALLGAAVLLAVQSVREILTPHAIPSPFTLVVLIAVVGIKTMMSRYTADVAASIGSTAVHGDAVHHLMDALTSALAFVGISIGLLTRWPQADAWAALAAVPIIAFTAVRQMRTPLNELLDTAQPSVEENVRQVALTVPGVRALDKCFVRKAGLSYYVDLHVMVEGTMSVRAGHEVAHAVQSAIKKALPHVADVLVHIEAW
jgi:cation diffusion facilitator family transporter